MSATPCPTDGCDHLLETAHDGFGCMVTDCECGMRSFSPGPPASFRIDRAPAAGGILTSEALRMVGETTAATPAPKEPTAKDSQVGGDHYQKHSIQPWDVWSEYGLNAFEGAVLKYLLRRKGDRVEDLKKARHTLDRLIEIEEGKG